MPAKGRRHLEIGAGGRSIGSLQHLDLTHASLEFPLGASNRNVDKQTSIPASSTSIWAAMLRLLELDSLNCC